MDIHKPKPVHSWRELLSEIGVVVIGIVIALLGEQMVEAVHHAEQRHELREALNHDSRQAIDDSKRSIAFFDSLIAWQNARLNEARTAKAAHRTLGDQPEFNGPDFDIPADPAFQAAVSSGRLSLLTQEEIAAYAEADTVTQTGRRAFDSALNPVLATAAFRLKFRRPDGTVNLSEASPAELDKYIDLTAENLILATVCRGKVLQQLGLREALLRGERDLPALYRSERSIRAPIPALHMK